MFRPKLVTRTLEIALRGSPDQIIVNKGVNKRKYFRGETEAKA